LKPVPVFFIGFPRSGTTLISEAFFRHDALGWPSLYSQWFPRKPWLNVARRVFDNQVINLAGQKASRHSRTLLGNRFLPQPAEAYRFWDLYAAHDFSRSYLRDRVADADSISRTRDAVQKLLKWQGRKRFVAKITGPPRIRFLNSIFPNAIFLHVVRDGRAAVHSLLNSTFWREKGGLKKPFWEGGLSQDDVQCWQAESNEPAVLAALQWKRIMEIAQLERKTIKPTCYCELRYEDFVQSPHELLRGLYEFCDLDDLPKAHKFLKKNSISLNLNDRYRTQFSESQVEKLSDLMQPMLSQYGYSS
jgi:hypothetical protein